MNFHLIHNIELNETNNGNGTVFLYFLMLYIPLIMDRFTHLIKEIHFDHGSRIVQRENPTYTLLYTFKTLFDLR